MSKEDYYSVYSGLWCGMYEKKLPFLSILITLSVVQGKGRENLIKKIACRPGYKSANGTL